MSHCGHPALLSDKGVAHVGCAADELCWFRESIRLIQLPLREGWFEPRFELGWLRI
jgi:hypothetical protein